MIAIDHVTKTYHHGKKNAFQGLKDFSERVEEGEFVAVVGESGAGKSTLLHLLACIDSFEEGEIEIDGKSIKQMGEKALAKMRNQTTAIVLQNFALIEEESVFENVVLPLRFSRNTRSEKREKVRAALKRAGIEELREKPVNELSGGQRQRVSIARALVNSPQYLFADEPTGALDSKTAGEIMEVFQELNRQGLTILLVTHNMELAQKCGRIIRIRDGKKVDENETVEKEA